MVPFCLPSHPNTISTLTQTFPKPTFVHYPTENHSRISQHLHTPQDFHLLLTASTYSPLLSIAPDYFQLLPTTSTYSPLLPTTPHDFHLLPTASNYSTLLSIILHVPPQPLQQHTDMGRSLLSLQIQDNINPDTAVGEASCFHIRSAVSPLLAVPPKR